MFGLSLSVLFVCYDKFCGFFFCFNLVCVGLISVFLELLCDYHKFIIGLDSFSNQSFIYVFGCMHNTSLCINYPVESYKITVH